MRKESTRLLLFAALGLCACSIETLRAQSAPWPNYASQSPQVPTVQIPSAPTPGYGQTGNTAAVNEALWEAAEASRSAPAQDPQEAAQTPVVSLKGKDSSLAIIRSLMAQPDNTIDLEKVEVTVEHLIDPRINEADTIKKLDTLAANIRARFPKGEATDTEVKGMILLTSLRDAGPWNDWQGFRYDFNNPFGTHIDDKLLSHFLATRLGNCVSMPVLFVVLGQKLGLPVTLSMAPKHEFAKFKKDNGEWTNVEVTSYGGQTDEHYVQKLDITPLALANHIWLQTLTRKQSALLLFQPLAEHYWMTRQPERELALTELLLKYEPKNVSLMVLRGDAFAQLSDNRYKRYGSPSNIPRARYADYQSLENNNQLMFKQAEALGWMPETAEHRAKYVQLIQQQRTR